MKRRRTAAPGPETSPAMNVEASPAPRASSCDEDALATLLASALAVQARRHDDDLPAELAASELLRTCLAAAGLAEGAAREAIVQTARREFDRAVKPSAPRARARSRAA